MSTATRINVIGIGYKPLDTWTSGVVHNSDVIISSRRLSEVFNGYEGFETVRDRIRVINNVDEVFSFIKSAIQNPQSKIRSIVFLASGDPLFFGIGRRMINEFGEDKVEIFPDLSCVQVAFSRIKEPWDNALLISIHGGPGSAKSGDLKYGINDIPLLVGEHDKICILTDRINNPPVIAREILRPSAISHQLSEVKMYVCEKLGYPDERIVEGTPEEISGMVFSEPNVVIIKTEYRIQNTEYSFGLKESDITHSRGLITKDEIRAVTIHKLKIPKQGVFWDIGAGSGSVSIEAARLFPLLKVFAVEKEHDQTENIGANKARFNVGNIEIIHGEAPDALRTLPRPDRVFIGGSGGKMTGIISLVSELGAETTVINATTIETLNEAVSALEHYGFAVDVSELSVSRSKLAGGKKHFNALNPVFIIKGEKG